MHWIDATDLKQWAFRRDCQDHLPLVVRRLIRATSPGISQILIPAGDSVHYSGWDGILDVNIGTEYIPEGYSVWEFSTNQKIKDKAEDDYQKRTNDALGVDRTAATYVFVTARVWADKDEWVAEKQRDGKWKDVRVYDATILEEWLEEAPAVGAWLAKYLRIFLDDVDTAEDYWKEWISATEPPLTSNLILSGREIQVEAVRQWLCAPPSLLTLQAASREEALAFFIAVTEKLSETEKDSFFSRCLIINNLKSFRSASLKRNPLILVNRFEETDAIGKALQNGHHVFVPLGIGNVVAREKIVLPRFEREAFVAALKEMGLSEEKAKKFSKDSGRSLSVLRRQLSSIANQPKWAQQESAREIIPAVLIGRWVEKNKSDRSAISSIAKEPYEVISGRLAKWLVGPDSPLYKIGDAWRLTSPIDALFALAPYLTKQDVESFKEVALDVLGELNPALELEPEDRWKASVYGKEPKYSGWLREGIAQTLVLIAVFGEEAGLSAVSSPQTWIDLLVKDLLYKADWKKWSSLTDILPLLAEASPTSFLEAVEESLSADEPSIMEMFSESGGITPSSAHTGLLWALEGLAWNPQLLGRATALLGELAKRDPGGKLCNRPISSLRDIFLLWLPQTFAPLEKRMEALDMLIDRVPEIGWKLLVTIMPQGHDTVMPTHMPRWREYMGNQNSNITIAEHLASISAVTAKIAANVGIDGNRWAGVIEKMPNLPPTDRQSIIEKLGLCSEQITVGREKAWAALRHLLYSHRSFPDADWALPDIELSEIEKIYSSLEPLEIYAKLTWLFDKAWPELPEGRSDGNYEEQQKIINQQRNEAISLIIENQGIKGIIAFAEKVSEPWQLGLMMAQRHVDQADEELILSYLEPGKSKEILTFSQAYVCWHANQKETDWISAHINKAKEDYWSMDKIINFALALPCNRYTWDQIEKFGSDVQEGYWGKCGTNFYGLPPDDKVYGIMQLLGVARFFTALDAAAMVAEELPSSLILEVLQKAVTAPADSEDSKRFDAHDVVRLFQRLDKLGDADEKELARLEWAFLPVLSKEWHGRSPRLLHKELASDPSFFAEVIKWIYKAKDEEKVENKELNEDFLQQRARRAYDLLSSWEIVPGSISGSSIDLNKLRDWVQKARQLCAESGRGDVGDSHIGKLLAHARAEKGTWPPEAVCIIIDTTNSEALDDGFYVGICKKRGVVTKAAFEGGRQERELANRFKHYSDSLSAKWPRTVSVLAKVAESYEYQAKMEDKDAERRDLEY